MRRWLFTVRLDPDGPLRLVEVVAEDSFHAVLGLPDGVSDWDFARFPGGAYSLPVDERQAA